MRNEKLTELKNQLEGSKRDISREHHIVATRCLENRSADRTDAWYGVYYSSGLNAATAINYGKKLEALKKVDARLAEIITPHVNKIVELGKYCAELKVKIEEARNAPAPVKVVPPNQATLAAALAGARVSYIARIHAYVTADADAAFAKLSLHNWDLNSAAPNPGYDDSRYQRAAALYHRAELSKYTTTDHTRPNNDGTHYRVRRSDLTAFIKAESERIGGFNFDSYVAKLTGKIERDAKREGNDKPVITLAILKGVLWDGCTLTVALNGSTQTWVTKCILNRSVLGKIFNQWPTRRSS